MSDKPEDNDGVGTTGHSWDGIEEWDNPMPRWWLWTFYATIVWGVIYFVLYPAWPLVERATSGVLGYSTRAEVAEQIAAVEAQNAALMSDLAKADLVALSQAQGTDLHGFAVNAGAAVFRNNCSQCHGAGAAGVQASGYPNLLDDAWLWAERSSRSPIPSPTASATSSRRTRTGRKCPPLAVTSCCRTRRSRRLCTMC